MIAVNQQQEMIEKRKQTELAKQNTIKLASDSLDKRMQELEKLKEQRQLARDQKQKEDSEIESRLQLEKLEQERVKNATQSFYSVILEHFRSVASNSHNVYSYFRESFDDLMDPSSIATELLNERIRILTSTISLIEEELKV